MKKDAQFKLFKEVIEKLIEDFGFKHWNISFYHKNGVDFDARFEFHSKQLWGHFILNKDKNYDKECIKKMAYHEFAHFLSVDLECLIIDLKSGLTISDMQYDRVCENFANSFSSGIKRIIERK